MIIYENSFIIQLQNTSNNGSPLSGTLSFIMNICILIFSNSYIRNKWYELFLYSHKIFVTLILTGAFFHLTTTVYYMIPSLTLYIIDVIIRFCRIKKSKYSSITILEENNVNKYIILKLILNKNVKITNSYYMICIKNISSSEWHPFSLLEQHNNTYVFCAKIIDDDKSWTGKINNKTIKDDIYIQGPYLYFENINFNIYNNIICITSGTGIIPILHKLKELNKIKINKKLDNLNNIILIWVSKDTCLVKYLLDYIIQLNHSYIKISIYITEPINFIGYDSSFIKYKRPNIKDIFKKFNIKKSKLCSQPKMAVLACGNDNLINDVKIQSNIYGLDFYNEKH
jgi:NAD(P)H-flavin reductase